MENEVAHNWNLVAYCIQEYRQIEDPEKRSLYFDDFLYLPFIELAKEVSWHPDYTLMLIAEAATEIEFWDGSEDCYEYFEDVLRAKVRRLHKAERLSEYRHTSYDAPLVGEDEGFSIASTLPDSTEFNYYFDEEEEEPETVEVSFAEEEPTVINVIQFRATASIPDLPSVGSEEFNAFKQSIKQLRFEMYKAQEEGRPQAYVVFDASYHRQWRLANKSSVQRALAAYRDRNREKVNERSRLAMAKKYETDPEHRQKAIERAREYRERNRELVRARDRERNRARRAAAKQERELQLA